MKFETLGKIVEQCQDYDEYRRIFIDVGTTLSKETRCYIMLGDDPSLGDYDAVPEAAKQAGMKPFLSSGQIADLQGAFDAEFGSYREEDFIYALRLYHEQQAQA